MKAFLILACAFFLIPCATASAEAEKTPPAEPFYFVQISDTHHGMEIHQWRFQEALRQINHLPVKPEVLVHTGDLSCDNLGRDDICRAITNILAAAKLPTLVVPGNHDLTVRKYNTEKIHRKAVENFRTYFGDFAAVHETANACYITLCTEPIRRLNSPAIPDFDPLEKLEELLRAAPAGKPVFLFTHVPDAPDFYLNEFHHGWENREGSRAFREIIARFPDVKAVIAGHFHRNVFEPLPNGACMLAGPSIATFWGRQGGFRIFTYQPGKGLSFQDVYIEDPPPESKPGK